MASPLLSVLLITALVFTASSTHAAVPLAEGGKSPYVIVHADDAPPPEKAAARELRDILHQVTGAHFPIMAESDLVGGDAPQILIGRTKQTTRLLPPGFAWDSLGQDGIVMKTAGQTLLLAGGRPRGTLYAVSTFLQDVVGVRWWTSTENTIPSRPTLSIGDLDLTYVPKFVYREVYNHDAIGADHAPFAVRMKLNGQHNTIPPELGGHYTLIGWCHTSFHLIPPEQYFAAHPDWFALLGGKRQTSGQLCLSNPAMRAELIRNVLTRVRKNPDAGIISISQEDRFGPCECADCRAIVEEEGSQSGPWIRLCNEAAEAINKEFPGFLVETLAYQYTRKPLKKTRPSEHVIVRLCSIESDFAHPLAGESNKSFGDDLRGWAAVAPNLFIWNYVTNFSNYHIPHPNQLAFADDLRFFAANKVVGVFEQGDAFNAAGDFLPLRTWTLARLLWDPAQDAVRLREEFLAGYYGAAAPHLAKYLQLINAKSATPDFRAPCYIGKPDYLSDDDIREANRHFDAAAESVRDNEHLARRVARERLTVEHVNLMRHKFVHAENDIEKAVLAYEARVQAWADACRAAGIKHFSEAQPFDAYVPSLLSKGRRLMPAKLPAAGAAMPDGWFDIQEDRFTLHQPPEKSALIDDPTASNGRAAQMPGGQTDWAVQFHVPANAPVAAAGPWDCHVVVRVEPVASEGAAFRFGIYDTARGPIADEWIGLELAGDGRYRPYVIAVNELTPTMYFWVCPPGDAARVKSVVVDRIVIQRRTAAQ